MRGGRVVNQSLLGGIAAVLIALPAAAPADTLREALQQAY